MNGKTMKEKICKTIALALVLGCCLSVPCFQGAGEAFAESSGIVSIGGADSAWKAYRLVAGEVVGERISECSTRGLMNEAFWKRAGIGGEDQDVAEQLAAIVADDANGAATARLGRAAIASHAPCVEVGRKEAEQGFSLPSGYWLLVSDRAQPMLMPVGPAGREATAKSSGPTVKKRVKDAAGRWRETAEAGQGQLVRFRIVASAPSNAAAYAKLPFKVVDELPEGMWVDVEGVRVAVRDAQGRERDVTSSCAITCSGGKLKVDVGKGNALAVLGDDPGSARVVVRYGAKLTEGSSAGAKTGNPNLAHVVCPGSPTSGKTVSTEKAVAQLFTWKVRVVKTGSGNPLRGATFELRSADGASIGKAVTDRNGNATFPSVASGTYRLVETEAPAGFKRAADTTLSLSADLGARGAKTRLSAHAEGAGSLKSANVAEGIVTVGIDDEPGSDETPEGSDSESEGISENPQTGDAVTWSLVALGAIALAGAAFAASRAARRREGKR